MTLRVCAHEVPVGRSTLVVHGPGHIVSAVLALRTPVAVVIEERDDAPHVEREVVVLRDGDPVPDNGYLIGSVYGRPSHHVYGVEPVGEPF